MLIRSPAAVLMSHHCMLQLGGQQPVNDLLPTGQPTSQQAVLPGDQLGTQKPAVTVQNVPAASAANRLGFTDRDTLPPVRVDDYMALQLPPPSSLLKM